jgi:arabinofuranosyltransferase
MKTKYLSYGPQLVVLAIVALTAVHYFNFTAEDAYITYRYAENFVQTGALVYNLGEPINAMTSPLHALVSAALFFVTTDTALFNKILGLILLLVSAWLVWRRFRGQPLWQLLALVLVLMPPAVLLWTFGGLETPLLLFFATLTVTLADRIRKPSLSALCLLYFLCGLAFLTRYDASLFLLPLVVYTALKARSIRNVLIAALIAAALPAGWVAISLIYYGDLLPTSFYVKTPDPNLWRIATNGEYIAAYLVFVGLVPVLAVAGLELYRRANAKLALMAHARRWWWLYTGLLLELAYGLTMATHHMMFSFRFFVPYLPAAAIVTVELARSAMELNESRPPMRFTVSLLPTLMVGLIAFQGLQGIYTYYRSVNGLSRIGEYQSLGVRDYIRFMQILKLEAQDIERHWLSLEGRPNRQPRILTYAGGMLPYTYRDAYIYEKLVSYRHCYQRYKQGLYADYIHLLAPRQGTVTQQLPAPEADFFVVSTYSMAFDGSRQSFVVYYNPHPHEQNLSSEISGACNPDE